MKHTPADGFPYYIELIGDAYYRQMFLSGENFRLLENINEEQSTYRYATDKWSIKQVVGHITDHERIMMYRALRFSRKDTTALHGYDQNVLVENSRFDELPFAQLLVDFKNVRAATNSFINSLSPAQLQLRGTSWKFELTVEEYLKATIGHEMHHMKIIKERYLNL